MIANPWTARDEYIYTASITAAMPNTHFKVYVKTIFAVKYRNALLEAPWREQFQGITGSVINQAGGQTLIVNSVEDHLHFVFSMKPSLSVSDVMQVAKGKSFKWINEQRSIPAHFEWQEGFGYFAYAHSQRDEVYRYIANQEAHRRQRTFPDEYTRMLQAFEIEYDEQYLFHAPL